VEKSTRGDVEIRLAIVRRVFPLFFLFVCQGMLIVFCLVMPLLPVSQGDMSWTWNIINLEIRVLLFQRVNILLTLGHKLNHGTSTVRTLNCVCYDNQLTVVAGLQCHAVVAMIMGL
jgi:hypothetical protein